MRYELTERHGIVVIIDNTMLVDCPSGSREGISAVVCQVVEIENAEEIVSILNICDGYTVEEISKKILNV